VSLHFSTSEVSGASVCRVEVCQLAARWYRFIDGLRARLMASADELFGRRRKRQLSLSHKLIRLPECWSA